MAGGGRGRKPARVPGDRSRCGGKLSSLPVLVQAHDMATVQETRQQPQTGPPRRVVLLGASNVTRGLSTAVGTALRLAGGPLELLAAVGHRRSYRTRRPPLFRGLPALLECGP